MRRSGLVSVLLLLAILVYIELRLPVPIDAQGRAAVYERVSVVDTVANALRVAGGATVAGAMNAGSVTTGTPIAPQYLGTGTRNGTKFLQDTGVWGGVSPPTAVSLLTTEFTTNSTSFVSTPLTVSLPVPTATSDVLLSLRVHIGGGSNFQRCNVGLTRGSTSIFAVTQNLTRIADEYVFPFVDVNPGTGTHTYTLQLRTFQAGNACRINNNGGFFDSLIGQVLQ